jgi:hypothetical protein
VQHLKFLVVQQELVTRLEQQQEQVLGLELQTELEQLLENQQGP